MISRIREEYNRVKAFVPDIEYPFNSSNLIPFFILCYLFVCVALSPADKISMICTAGILHPSVFVCLAEEKDSVVFLLIIKLFNALKVWSVKEQKAVFD